MTSLRSGHADRSRRASLRGPDLDGARGRIARRDARHDVAVVVRAAQEPTPGGHTIDECSPRVADHSSCRACRVECAARAYRPWPSSARDSWSCRLSGLGVRLAASFCGPASCDRRALGIRVASCRRCCCHRPSGDDGAASDRRCDQGARARHQLRGRSLRAELHGAGPGWCHDRPKVQRRPDVVRTYAYSAFRCCRSLVGRGDTSGGGE